MKVFLGFCVLVTLVIYSQCFDNEDRSICLKESNLEESDIKTKDFKVNEKVKCYLKCALKRSGYMKENGDLQGDLALTDVSLMGLNDARRQQIAECINKIGKVESCDDAFLVNECFMQAFSGKLSESV